MATPVVTPSPSGPAPESTLKIPARGTPEHAHWRMTGELSLPESKPNPKAAASEAAEIDESNDLPDIPSGDAGKPASEAAAAPESAPTQEPPKRKRTDANQRIRELLEENRQLRQKAADVKPPSSPAAEPVKEVKPEKAARPTPQDVDPKTNQAKYKTWAEYEDALLAWNTEQVLAKVDERLATKDRNQKVEGENQRLIKDFQGQVDSARSKYADYDEVALNNQELAGKIPRGSVIDLCILQTPLGAETLYYLGKHPEKIAEILKLQPFQQSTELVKIQMSLEKPAASNPPVKPKSKAPEPPAELGTRAVVPGDETERAVKADDFRAYRESANAKDLARRRKG